VLFAPQPEVLTNDVDATERAIEEESPAAVFNSDVKLKLKEETEDGGNARRRR
jgi:hypothetical protein